MQATRAKLFVDYSGYTTANTIDVRGVDTDLMKALVVDYVNVLKGLFTEYHTLLSIRGYAIDYDNTTEQWVSGVPIWEHSLDITGTLPTSTAPMPLGMGIYIATRDDTPLRAGRLLVKTRLDESFLTANGTRWSITTGTQTATHINNVIADLQAINVIPGDTQIVNLHKGTPIPSVVTSHQLKYVNKYTYPKRT